MPYISHRRVDCNIRSTSARGRLPSGSPLAPGGALAITRAIPIPAFATIAPPSRGRIRQRGLPGSSGSDHGHRSTRHACVPGRARWPPAMGRSSRQTCSASWSTCHRPACVVAELRRSVIGVGHPRAAAVGPGRRLRRHGRPPGRSIRATTSTRSPTPSSRRSSGRPATRAVPASRWPGRPIAAERARWDRRGFHESDRCSNDPSPGGPDRHDRTTT